MTDNPTPIGFIIQPGQSIPDDVTEVDDKDGDHWFRSSRTDYPWGSSPNVGGFTISGLETWFPLTVTAVREQPAEPEPVSTQLYWPVGLPAAIDGLKGVYTTEEAAREAAAEPGLDFASIYLDRAYPFFQKSDAAAPLVLRLPEVPEGAVALQGGARWVRSPYLPDSWVLDGGSVPHMLGALIDAEDGSVTVVMREPRTWPRLDGAPEDLEAFGGASGRRYAYSVTGSNGVRYYKPVDAAGSAARPVWHWQGVDGPLVEVFDAEDGTR